MRADALVVGAGPSGLITARHIADRGFSTRVFEEHKSVGTPNHCAGLISVSGLEQLGIKPSNDFIQNEIYGGRVYSPSGEYIEIRDSKVRAYALDRSCLDKMLVEQAVEAGAEVCLKRHVTSIDVSGKGVIGIHTNEGKETSKLVIDAEGASRRLLLKSRLAISICKPLIGANTIVQGDVSEGMVEIWLGKRFAPGFFAWVIPVGPNLARAGLACNDGMAVERLKSFIKHRFKLEKHGRITSGQVLVDGPVDYSSYPGLLLVGDAAGHVKPTTGGGVVLGGLCAVEAAKTACKAFESDDSSGVFLYNYDKSWRMKYGSEFSNMLKGRRIFEKLTDENFNSIVKNFKTLRVIKSLNKLVKSGDMDLQEGIIMRALKEPALIFALTKSLGSLALWEIRSLIKV